MAGKWKTLDPAMSRQLSMLIVAAATGVLLRTFDPEGWKPVGAILRYSWVIFPAWFAYIMVDVFLMLWFGKRTADGKPVELGDPLGDRLDRIERAIDRLHEYVQDLDSDLDEERRLEREFMSGSGGMFAGKDHHDYVRAREAEGRRTIRGQSIWRDPPQTA